PTHDLAAARFGERFGKAHFIGSGDSPDVRGNMPAQFILESIAGSDTRFQCDECDHRLALPFVRSANDRCFCHSRMTHQRALDLGRAQPVPGYVEDVVDSAHDPEVAVLVAARAVAGEIITLKFAPVLLAIAPLVAVDGAQHRGPRPANDEFPAHVWAYFVSSFVHDSGVNA